MTIEKIDEAVGVFAVFSGGQVSPVRFRWGARELDVFAINARWTDRQIGGCTYHYSVQAGEETYFLHFSSSDLQWWLDQVVLDG
jgi:hypothetical protein